MLRIAICDDDQRDLLKLNVMLEKIMKKYSIRYDIALYDSGKELLDSQLLFHLIFLDIQMGEINGIEIGKKIYKKNRSAKVVFQTLYGEYCRAAINESHAFAFLEKPLEESLVEGQIREFLERQESVQEMWIEFKHIYCTIDNEEREKERLRIPIKDIIYFEYLKGERRVRVVTEQTEFIYLEVMSVLEEKMKPFGFEVCSRGILVNLDKIKRIKGCSIFLCKDIVVPLSQRRMVYFKERMNEFVNNSFWGNRG